MSQRYPNANYPEAYDEADMEKADAVAVNADGNSLVVSDVTAPYGPLLEHAVTGADVKGVTLRDAVLPDAPKQSATKDE